VKHKDSMGNAGSVNAGDVPMDDCRIRYCSFGNAKTGEGGDGGIPALGKPASSFKMMDPRYQEITHTQIPTVSPLKGVIIRVSLWYRTGC